MGMERLKRMFDTGDGRQAEGAIDRESALSGLGYCQDRRRSRGLFNEKSFRIMKLPNQVSLRKGQLNQYVCERVS